MTPRQQIAFIYAVAQVVYAQGYLDGYSDGSQRKPAQITGIPETDWGMTD